MPQDQSDAPTGRAASESDPGVIEWGADGPPPSRAARALTGLRSHPRLAPTVAALAALALFGSVLFEWRIWTAASPEEGGPFPQSETAHSVVSLGSVGTAYLVGLFALAAFGTLALFGAGAVRRHARLVGLSSAVVLLALLVTASTHLDQLGGTIDDLIGNRNVPGSPALLRPGRGIYLAFLGVIGAAVALYLAAPARRGPSGPATAADRDHLTEEDGGDWPWRRPPAVEPSAAGPVDLTVEPAAPFLPPDDQDRPR
jgi:hypothetical protein